jgi:eukaryotic-like serine/threonine-protein kinase
MTVAVGARFDHYEILAPLGAGGMGEVYRARDERLGRDVAIKILPASFANDTDRLLRFEQEARATSALNHPNILTIYDIGSHDGAPYIVAELLEGEELREQLSKGALPQRKALDYAQQIAAGLSAAHERGITHRDLKPENIFVTTDGRVKILDFGLAKLKPAKLAAGASSEVATQKAITDAGTVMGTVGYMSPEQVRGKDADHRSDIFSFGVILYEMLRGRRTFTGESAIEVMNAILKEEPEELTETNAKISPALERIVRRCLEKKPERRFQSTSDLCFAIEALSMPSGSQLETAAVLPAVTESTGKARLFGNARLAWIIAAVFLLVSAASLPFAIAYLRRAPASAEAIRFSVSPPEGESFDSIAVSPDGRRVAFVAEARGKRLLWVRPLYALTAQPLAGTEDAFHPFWSPDGHSIGFFTGSEIKKVDLSGGLAQTLCETTAWRGAGGSWSREGVIIIGKTDGLFRVAATGGAVSTLAQPDQARQETGYRWPFFLPDGRHFVFCVESLQPENRGIYLGSLDQGRLQRLAPDISNVAWAASAEGGYLLFLRGGALMAQPFDADKLMLTGEPVRIAEKVRTDQLFGRGFFSVSENGVLVYDSNIGNQNSQLVWLDRTGKQLGVAAPLGSYNRFRLSPNDRRIVLEQYDARTGSNEIWVRDLPRSVTSRFTDNPADDEDPIWSPDGSRIVWRSNRGGIYDLYQKSAGGMGQDELLLHSGTPSSPGFWSADGRFIVYLPFDLKTGNDVWVLPLEGDRKPYPLLQSRYYETNPRPSPDGRWLAYTSNESGRLEVHVTTFPSPGAKWQISTDGGAQPYWRRDGKELYYVAANNRLMAVAVQGGAASKAGFEAGVPQPLFEMRLPFILGTSVDFYYAAADGQRFLVNTPVGEATAAPLVVVVNWTAEVKK